VFGGKLVYPFTGARELLRRFADFDAHAPDELYVDVLLPAILTAAGTTSSPGTSPASRPRQSTSRSTTSKVHLSIRA